MGAPPSHFCPGCGKALPGFLRYPWYFCSGCVEQAEDGAGRRLVFFNAFILGGFAWAYADAPQALHEAHAQVICLLHGRPVAAQEARFGGIVVQPFSDSLREGSDPLSLDLRRSPS